VENVSSECHQAFRASAVAILSTALLCGHKKKKQKKKTGKKTQTAIPFLSTTPLFLLHCSNCNRLLPPTSQHHGPTAKQCARPPRRSSGKAIKVPADANRVCFRLAVRRSLKRLTPAQVQFMAEIAALDKTSSNCHRWLANQASNTATNPGMDASGRRVILLSRQLQKRT